METSPHAFTNVTEIDTQYAVKLAKGFVFLVGITND